MDTCCLLFQKNTKTQKVRLWGDNLKQESLASFEPSVSHRGWKRNTEGTDPDVEYIAEAKIMTKSPQKKAKPQQHRRPAALRANVSRAQESQVFFFSYPQNIQTFTYSGDSTGQRFCFIFTFLKHSNYSIRIVI